MKIYLSGKITGDANYRQKFGSMEKELLSYGYVVFNPAILPDGFEYEDYMDLDLLILSRCDAIFLMRDWKNSPGATREYEEAKRLGLRILTEEDLDNFTHNITDECKTIYLGHNVLPTEEQEKLFKKHEIKINIIPDYYYRDLEG